jgi:hypothetical protein
LKEDYPFCIGGGGPSFKEHPTVSKIEEALITLEDFFDFTCARQNSLDLGIVSDPASGLWADGLARSPARMTSRFSSEFSP